MKQKHIDYFMDIAERTAQLSSARRTKVGSIIVKDDRIISIGYNGTPSGWSNDCVVTMHNVDMFDCVLWWIVAFFANKRI